MATWNSIRIPHFITKERLSREPTLTAASPLTPPPPLSSIREVKRNPFPADLLKSKSATRPTSDSASSIACKAQILDLTRRTHSIVSHFSSLHSYGTFKRSRSERKEDWDMAMYRLMDGHATPPSDKIPENLRVTQVPILENILLPEDYLPILHASNLPTMLLIPPPKKVSVLSIESNMCFELEFLKSVSEDLGFLQGQRLKTNENSYIKSFLNKLEWNSSKKVVDPRPREKQMESPLLKSTEMEKFSANRNLKQHRLSLALLPHLGDITSDLNVFETKGSASRDLNMAELKDIEKYKVSFLEALAQSTKGLKNCSTSTIDLKKSWSKDIIDIHLFKRDEVKGEHLCANDIDRPFLLRTVFDCDNENRILTWKLPLPGIRTTSIRTNELFESLSGFQRHLYTSERSIWSRASKEVMSRAKYKRRRLLLSHYHLVSLILSSGNGSARSIVSSSVRRTTEVLDSHVFTRLKAISVACQERKSRTMALLDKLDFVSDQVARSRQRFLNKCCQRVRKTLHTFDSPTRKWSQVHFEQILPRYQRLKPCSEDAKESHVRRNSLLEEIDVDSDESALDDFVLSDTELAGQELGINGFGMLEELRGDLRRYSPRKTGTAALNGDVQQKNSGNVRDFSMRTHKKLKVRLKVPDALVCAPWVVQAAELCVKKMPRGAIFIPPPLSALPVVAIVTSSYLRDTVRDQRVAVVCESETDVTSYIREYLQSSLGESISIDSVMRSEYGGVEKIAPLPHTTARVIILDSFCFSFSIPFSLLIVFVSTEAGFSAEHVRLRDRIFDSDVSQWVRIPFVLLAPLDAWVGLQTYSQAVRHMSEGLRVKDMLWVKAKDDIRNLTVASSPRVVYLAPTQQATQLACMLDARAAPLLQAYKSLNRTSVARTTNKTWTLLDASLRAVRENMQNTLNTDNAILDQRLEVLYTFRQARTFAIYDGFHIAVDYLEHCSKQSKAHVRRAVSKLLKDLEDQRDEITFTSNIHPVVKVLKEFVRKAERSMSQDPSSLRSVHCRNRFHALIVANSQEAVSGCLQGLEDAVHLNEATRGCKAVCSLQDLKRESKKRQGGDLRETLEKFSHVFHIADDRYDVPSDLLLPPSLQQQVHAGRTRLITIAVDESRELDDRWQREVSLYDVLSRNLEKDESGDTAYGEPYLQQISVERFCSVAKISIPAFEGLTKEVTHASKPSDRNINKPHQSNFLQQKPGTLHLTSHQICSSTTGNLRAILYKDLMALPIETPTLRVLVFIKPSENCTPATTYLHSAIAGDKRLHQKVIVDTVFLF